MKSIWQRVHARHQSPQIAPGATEAPVTWPCACGHPMGNHSQWNGCPCWECACDSYEPSCSNCGHHKIYHVHSTLIGSPGCRMVMCECPYDQHGERAP